jgi:hypothetical protein
MNHQLVATHRLWVVDTLMDKFDGTNYMLWQFMMEMMFSELWGLINKMEVKPDEIDVVTIATFVKKENEAHNLLI